MKAFLSERENFMVKKVIFSFIEVDEGMLICKRIEAVLDRD